jgi:hypothetical protein
MRALLTGLASAGHAKAQELHVDTVPGVAVAVAAAQLPNIIVARAQIGPVCASESPANPTILLAVRRAKGQADLAATAPITGHVDLCRDADRGCALELHDGIGLAVALALDLEVDCAATAYALSRCLIDLTVAVIVHAIAEFFGRLTVAIAVLIDEAVAVIIDLITACFGRNLTALAASVLHVFICESVAVVVEAVADFFGGLARRAAIFVRGAIAIVVETVVANFCWDLPAFTACV